jgi:hypothetical protein
MMGMVLLYETPLYQVTFVSFVNLLFGIFLIVEKPLDDESEYKKVL